MTQIFLLRTLIADTLQEVNNLRKDLITGRAAQDEVTSLFTKYSINFPLSSMEDLRKFEQFLSTDSEFKDAVSIITKKRK